MVTQVKTKAEIKAMRRAGEIWAEIMSLLKTKVVPGVSTKALADLAAQELKKTGGEPAFLGYQGFPDVICISINEEVVHGIPRANKIIEPGDIVGLDFGVRFRGLLVDAAISVVAEPHAASKKYLKLVKDTEAALLSGIASVHDGVRTGDIGQAIEGSLKPFHYGIVRDLVGHGVGHEVHEDPNIPNFGRANTGPWLSSGMTIAIEPMVTLGSEKVFLSSDGWTILTVDGSASAHFEHTVLITGNGSEILTKLD